MKCPICNSNKVTLTDNEPLDNYRDKPTDGKYFFDEEIYADAKCWECNHEFKVIGVINWSSRTN